MTLKRLISALLVLFVLFATIARAPGVMLSAHEGILTFEICTGDGIQTISAPLEETPPQTDCEYFTAHIAALLGGAPDTQIIAPAIYVAKWPLLQGADVQSEAAFSHLIRGPPILS